MPRARLEGIRRFTVIDGKTVASANFPGDGRPRTVCMHTLWEPEHTEGMPPASIGAKTYKQCSVQAMRIYAMMRACVLGESNKASKRQARRANQR